MDSSDIAIVAVVVILLIGWGIYEVMNARRGGK